MNTKEIEYTLETMAGSALDEQPWLTEIALQLAKMNDRAEANDETQDQLKRALGKKTFQIHQVLDKANVPLIQGKTIRGEDIPLTLIERVRWITAEYIGLMERARYLEEENTRLVIEIESKKVEVNAN